MQMFVNFLFTIWILYKGIQRNGAVTFLKQLTQLIKIFTLTYWSTKRIVDMWISNQLQNIESCKRAVNLLRFRKTSFEKNRTETGRWTASKTRLANVPFSVVCRSAICMPRASNSWPVLSLMSCGHSLGPILTPFRFDSKIKDDIFPLSIQDVDCIQWKGDTTGDNCEQ